MKVLLTLCLFCFATLSSFAQSDFTNPKTMERMKAALGLSPDQASHILRLEVGHKAKLEQIMEEYPDGEEKNEIISKQMKEREAVFAEIMSEQQFQKYKSIVYDREGFEQYQKEQKSRGKEQNVLKRTDGIIQ